MSVITKRKILIFSLICIVVLALAALEITNTTHWLHKSPMVSIPSKPITSLPRQSSAKTTADNKTPAGSSFSQQTGTDEKGKIPNAVPTDPNKWLMSQSGMITVKLPTANTLFKSGDKVFGSSKVSGIQYRLIDDQSGVISQGHISVVDGNFTAAVHFTAHGITGRLDVFSADDNGRESNEVQVPVNFK